MINLLTNKGEKFTETFFLNSGHDWSKTNILGLWILRSFIGPLPFTQAVRNRLRNAWSDDVISDAELYAFGLADNEFLSAISRLRSSEPHAELMAQSIKMFLTLGSEARKQWAKH